MFETIQSGLSEALRKLRGQAKFTEQNIAEGLGAVRNALLEADVNYDVAHRFIERVKAKAVGQAVLKSLNPSQQIVQIVYEELVELMGPVDTSIKLASGRPTVIMMCGLQGSGKTTTVGKLGRMFQQQGHRPLLAAADLQRPAAIEQLQTLGQQLQLPVYSEANSDPVRVCQNAVAAAKAQNRNVVILDTAGRLHIDDELMRELQTIDRRVGPDLCLLVADAMTGQDAVQSAGAFNKALELDAVILTKLDGDARGGAALSIKEVTGVPIKFVGMGEKLDALEPFRPEGMAQRILGMGDILSLVEQARSAIDEEQAAQQQERLLKGKFDLNDFREMLGQVKMMGSMRSLMEKLPMGFDKMIPDGADPDLEVNRISAMLSSMTPFERAHPEVINISRRRRIAQGAGVQHHEVNKLIKQFDMMRPIMKEFSSLSTLGRLKRFMGMGQSGAFTGDAPMRIKDRSKRNPMSSRDLAKARKAERQRKKQNRKRK